MKQYVSEFDQWLRAYKEQHPETEQQQREGRALLWEKRSDQIKATITNKQQGYVYYPIDNTNK